MNWLKVSAIACALLGNSVAVAQVSAPIEVIDQRPAAQERPWRTLSINIASCNYGVWQVSEEVGEGNRLTALRDDLATALNADAGVTTITVTRYDVYLNRAVSQRGLAGSVTAGAVGGYASVGGPQRPSCSRDRMEAGWFDAAEMTTSYTPLIIEITARANGREFVVHTTYSPTIELQNQCAFICPRNSPRPLLQLPEHRAEFRAAMRKAHNALAAQINASEPAPPTANEPSN